MDLEQRTHREGEHLIWPGPLHSKGYGVHTLDDGRRVKAHRWVYEQATGQPIPPGAYVLHLCELPACVEPSHLRLSSDGPPRPNAFGARLRELRATAGLDVETAARRVGVDPATWSRWESGRRAPHLGRLPVLAAALSVDPADLVA